MIHEYKRKAQGISVEKIHPYAISNIQTPAVELSRQIIGLLTWAESKEIEAEVFWPLFALSLVLTETKVSPPLSSILRVLNGDFDNTWSFIQLTARLQAALYSLPHAQADDQSMARKQSKFYQQAVRMFVRA